MTKQRETVILEVTIKTHGTTLSAILVLTRSVAFTEVPLSQSSFTLEEHPAITVETKSRNNCDHFIPFDTQRHVNIAQV